MVRSDRIEAPDSAGGRRSWPLQWYFAALAVMFMAVAAAAIVFVNTRASTDARNSARREARFIARTAANQLGTGITQISDAVRGLAANPGISTVLTKPADCSLSFSGGDGVQTGHLDIVRADNGAVVCSSLPRTARVARRGYAGADWLQRAKAGQVLAGPW